MKVYKKQIFLYIFIVLFGIVLFPFVTKAENNIVLSDSELNIEVYPESPEPYQEVTIKIKSYSVDLNKSIIEWKNEQGVVLSGVGKTSYSFKTGGPNSSSIFDVKISPIGTFGTTEKRIVVIPTDLDIFWEAVDGYVPPFYKGKSFASTGGMIKAVAIPNTNTIQSGKGNMVYTWKNNDNTNLESSGYNKDSFTLKNSQINQKEVVTAIVSSVDGKYNAKKTIEIPISSPKIIFYKKSLTDGILYNNALKNSVNVPEEEMTIVAEPYFFYLNNKDNNYINYKWSVSGKEIKTPTKKNELTIRPDSRGGYATIGLVIENMRELFQKVSAQLKVNI